MLDLSYLEWLVVVDCVSVCIFFFKQKTAYEMRISDWSSDVCSSDLRQSRFESLSGIHIFFENIESGKTCRALTAKDAQPGQRFVAKRHSLARRRPKSQAGL